MNPRLLQHSISRPEVRVAHLNVAVVGELAIHFALLEFSLREVWLLLLLSGARSTTVNVA